VKFTSLFISVVEKLAVGTCAVVGVPALISSGSIDRETDTRENAKVSIRTKEHQKSRSYAAVLWVSGLSGL
jgi:hypothetical protein